MNAKKTIGWILGLAGCAAAGIAIGAANYYYEYCLTPKGSAPDRAWALPRREIEAGRRWVNGHVRRQDVFIISDDGLQLHGNYIKAAYPDAHRYAICVHGFYDDSTGTGIYAKRYYEEHGMTVLLPDLRGHGSSEGSYIGMGYRDSRDLLRWINFIVTQDPQAVIILHGVSLGAAAVCMACAERLPSQVKAVISDSAFTNASEMVTSIYNSSDRAFIPASFMVPCIRALCLLRARYALGKANCVRALSHSQVPVLFIHGEEDDFAPASMMPKLYEAAAGRKDFLWIRGASHKQAVIRNPERYWKKVEKFLGDISVWILNDNLRDTDPFAEM